MIIGKSRKTMSFHKTITDIRSLCGLGLDSQVVMPMLLQMLHEFVPSQTNVFFWVAQDGELSNLIAEECIPPQVLALYLRDYYNRHEAAVRPRFTDAVREEKGVTDWEEYYSQARYLRSEFYNNIMLPQGARYTLRAYIPCFGRNAGLLVLRREPRAKPFSERDKLRLAQIIPYLSHALSVRNPPATAFTGGTRSGVLMLAQDGALVGADAMGQHLLFLANHPRVNARSVADDSSIAAAAILKQLSMRIGQLRQEAAVPSAQAQLQNEWGLFRFKAHLVSPAATGTDPLIGITIEHCLPLLVHLLGAMKEAPLSAKQKEVCLWLLDGLSQTHIAQRMGISPHSVNDYLKKTYRKLDVHSKDELMKKLLIPGLRFSPLLG
jgi:DNA-binding CsgD family transcriptional regulator